MTIWCLASYVVIAHSAYLSIEVGFPYAFGRHIKVFKTLIPTIIVLPTIANMMIAKCLAFLREEKVHDVLTIFYICFEMLTPILYTNWAKSYGSIVAEEIFTNFCFQKRALISEDYQEAIKYRQYLIEWRNEASLWTTSLILFINFEKITSILKSHNRAIPMKFGKMQIAEFLTNPMLTIVYISLLLYLESYTSIMFTLWILYTTFILSKELIAYLKSAPREMIFLSIILIVPFFVMTLCSVVFWMSLFPVITLFTILLFRDY